MSRPRWRIERDDLLIEAGAQKRAHAGEAAVAG
jgi:hypothetical protein